MRNSESRIAGHGVGESALNRVKRRRGGFRDKASEVHENAELTTNQT